MVYLYAVLPVPAAVLGVLYIGSDMLGVLGVSSPLQQMKFPFVLSISLMHACKSQHALCKLDGFLRGDLSKAAVPRAR